MQYISHYDSPLGGMTLASSGQALTGLWFNGQKHFAATLVSNYEHKELSIFTQTKYWLDRYFSGEKTPSVPRLALQGSEFRLQVWQLLLEIPRGEVTTYGEIAGKIAHARGVNHFSAQAVGGAVAHNPISIIIPCHRVIGASDNLTGYAGGIDRKIQLLALEGVDTSALHSNKSR